MKYANLLKRPTPQSAPLPNAGHVRNSAGGYLWEVTPWMLLDRFLILGSELGTFYVRAEPLTAEHAANLQKLIDENGLRVVDRIVEVSEAGWVPKNDPAIFALSMAATFGDNSTRASALAVLPRVCRTGTHLFQFAEAVESLRGWGRGLRRAIGGWYNEKSTVEAAYQFLKYGQRCGWTHRDLLRLAHPAPASEAHGALFKWVTAGTPVPDMPNLQAAAELKDATPAKAANLIRDFRLPREAVPTELLGEVAVWDALLDDMPMTAMIRNLGVMSKVGLLEIDSEALRKVFARLADRDRLRKARVHPITMLLAQRTYASGHGLRGSGTWVTVQALIDALDDAFYATFENVESTGKRFLLGIDISGSMGSQLQAGITAAEAAAAMAMVTLRAEPYTLAMGFAHQFVQLPLSAGMRLKDVLKETSSRNFGATDCALPMLYALEHKLKVDAFVIYTDSETWYGGVHPSEALNRYREATGINARLVVMGMAGNRFTIADPRDAGMLDVVGFDASAPTAMDAFLRG